MSLTSTSSSWSEPTQAELDRFGFRNPYDPHFIHTAIFGTQMSGHSQRWPDIDFSVLAKVNSDVVGWIHMPQSPIDYPIVAQHFDRNYYLSHNFSGEESLHGQVALAFECARHMGAYNTLLSAHTMADWSMFRAVRALCEQSYFDTHPTVDLMAVDGTCWQGRWFAALRYASSDPWPQRTHFSGEMEYLFWLERLRAHNWLHSDVAVDKHTRVLTCCTCAQTPGQNDMRAVCAVLTEA